MNNDKKAVGKAAEKTMKYIGPPYNKGLVIGKKTYRPGDVKPDEIEQYLNKNPKLKKYFR